MNHNMGWKVTVFILFMAYLAGLAGIPVRQDLIDLLNPALHHWADNMGLCDRHPD